MPRCLPARLVATPLATILLLAVACITALPSAESATAADYLKWLYVNPPAALTGLPIIRIGSTFSTAGVNQVAGQGNQAVLVQAVNLANARGGVWMGGVRYALSLQYISDYSSPDLIFTFYTQMAAQVKRTLESLDPVAPVPIAGKDDKINGMPPLHILFSPHFTDMTLPALTACQAQNVTMWAIGSSGNSIYPGYPYVWGNGVLANHWLDLPLGWINTYKPKTAAYFNRANDQFATFNYNAAKAMFEAEGCATTFTATLPSQWAGADPNLEEWFYKQFSDPKFPQDVDVFLLTSVNPLEINIAASALRRSGKTPKVALYNQFNDEQPSTLVTIDQWISIFIFRTQTYIRSTLPGTLYADSFEFQRLWKQNNPTITLTPLNGRQAGSVEGMFATLNVTKSLTSEDLRKASLSLSGWTIFSYLQYNPKDGSNPYQTLQVTQAIDGKNKVLNSAADIQYPAVWPWTLPVPPIKYTQTSGQFAIMIVCFVLLAIFAIIVALFLVLRTHRVLHAASTTMLGVALVGAAMVLVAAVLAVLPPNKANCAASSWLFNLGWTITLCSIFAKTFRLNAIFNAKRLQQRNITDNKLLIGVGAFVLMDIILLAIRSGVAEYVELPVHNVCSLRPWQPVDRLGNTPVVIDHDAEKAANAINGLLIATKGVLLLTGAVLVFKVRNLPSLYNESSFLAGVIYNTVFVSIFWIGIRYSLDFDTSESGSLAILEAALMLFGTLVIVGLIFIPKYVVILQQHLEAHRTGQRMRKGDALPSRRNKAAGGSGGFDSVEKAGNGTVAGAGADNRETTLSSVRDAFLTMIAQLEQYQRRAEVELKQLLAKVDAKRESIASTAMSLLQVRSETQYLEEFGGEMSVGELRALLQERTAKLSSTGLSGIGGGGETAALSSDGKSSAGVTMTTVNTSKVPSPTAASRIGGNAASPRASGPVAYPAARLPMTASRVSTAVNTTAHPTAAPSPDTSVLSTAQHSRTATSEHRPMVQPVVVLHTSPPAQAQSQVQAQLQAIVASPVAPIVVPTGPILAPAAASTTVVSPSPAPASPSMMPSSSPPPGAVSPSSPRRARIRIHAGQYSASSSAQLLHAANALGTSSSPPQSPHS